MHAGNNPWHDGVVTPVIELRHLRYFAAVVQEGTFTAAADRLGMTQPALSRAVRALEREFGSALLRRGPAGVELTAAGEVLFREAQGIDESVSAALARARRAVVGPRLRVTARGCDVGTLMQFVRAHADTGSDTGQVEPAVVDRSEQLEEIRRGAADITLVRAPFERRGLDSELLRVDPRVLLVPAGHRLAGRKSVDRAELAGESFPVWAGYTAAEIAWWTGTDLADHAWRPGPVVQDGTQYLAAVRLGQAIAFLPETMLAESPLTGIAVVAVKNVSGSELHLAWAQDATSAEVARFVRSATQSVDLPGRAAVPSVSA
jgi:DNA-binding transcriptional LysR family regulator